VTQSSLTYEYPLNERFRTFLRAEHLFALIKLRFHDCHSSWDARECVATIAEVYNLIERTEIRNEILKELERHTHSLERLAKTPSVNSRALGRVLANLEAASEKMKGYFDKQSFYPGEQDIFHQIRQRLSLPGGACSFDLPAFHYWLHMPVAARQYSLEKWLKLLAPMEESLGLVLELTRQSANATREVAERGSFQRSLNTQNTYQLIQVNVPMGQNVFPEISGSKHRINIRFMEAQFEDKRPNLTNQDVAFELNCCTI